MANYQRNNNQNSNNNNYQNGNNYNSGNNNNGGGQRQAKKHSGCKEGQTNGKRWIRAWNYSKGKGMVTVLVAEYHGTKDVENSKGEVSTLLMAKIFYANSGVTLLRPCLLKHQTGKVTIDELGWVLNPKAPNGGYCGTFTK